MIRVYRASSVRLAEPIAGTIERTIRVESLERLLIDPVSCQAFMGLKSGKTIAARYIEATFADGEFDKCATIHQCDQCNEVFETAQGLAGHRRIHEPRKETKEFISEMQTNEKRDPVPAPVQSRRSR